MGKFSSNIEGFRQRGIEPRVYAILFEAGLTKDQVLQMFLAESLEAAFADFMNTVPEDKKRWNWRILLWNSVAFKELQDDSEMDLPIIPKVVPKENPLSQHNKLLKEIIDLKNKDLFERHKSKFSAPEIKMIKDKLGL